MDLFPPGKGDPQGIHGAIWAEISDEPFALPSDKPLTLAAYSAGPVKTAYVEPVAVGDELPEMPLFSGAGGVCQRPPGSDLRGRLARHAAAVETRAGVSCRGRLELRLTSITL